MPAKYRHRIAMYADDMAAGANTMEELLELYKALVTALDKAGIQGKPAKLNSELRRLLSTTYYRVIGGDGPMSNTTTPKDETLDPIRHCAIPQTVTQLKAFGGSTQQMAYYVPYYARTSSRPASQTHPQRRSLPKRIQMDCRIRLRSCIPPRSKPHFGSSLNYIHME